MKAFSNRYNVIVVLFFICAATLVIQAARIQVFSQEYRNSASKYTIDKQTQYPSRGLIYDRNGEVLVYNIPTYDLQATYNKVSKDMDTSLFCELLELKKDTFESLLEKNWKSNRYSKSVPFTFLSKISSNTFAKFQEHLYLFPGFSPVLRYVRSYPHQNAAHLLGYLGEVDQKQIDENKDYSLGDYIGVSGLEKTYEKALKGVKGSNLVLKDVHGRDVGSFNEGKLDSMAHSGIDLKTSIDLELQAFGEKLMQNKKGSIVAIEPKSGEILSIISAPSYDPNILSLNQNRNLAFSKLLNDSTLSRPFMDRSVMAKYPPGSIFKPIFSLIALQEGVTYANRPISCDGEYTVNKKRGFSQGCHAHPRPYNISVALEHSCNSYYYQIMREFIEQFGYSQPGKGMDLLKSYLTRFGLGTSLGVDSHLENKGFVPDSKYFDRLYNYVRSGWRSTYVLSLGIGQGELQLTTLQMANLAAILANKGYFYTPHLLQDYSEIFATDNPYQVKQFVGIDSIHFDPVIKGMERVIKTGTAQIANIPGIDVCGKTGTSQNPHGKDHSVFFAFAPKEDPKIAIAVYVENAGFGGVVAAPIASLMIEKYINKTLSPSGEWKKELMLNTNLINTAQ